MDRRRQPRHPLDFNRRRASAIDRGTHARKQSGQILNLGLTGGVADPGGSLCHDSGEQQILGGSYGWKLEKDLSTAETVRRRGMEYAVNQLEFGAHRL